MQSLGHWRYGEEALRYFAEVVLCPGAWAIDVGAGLGHTVASLATARSPAGRVVAFEPVYDLLAQIKHQVSKSPGGRTGSSLIFDTKPCGRIHVTAHLPPPNFVRHLAVLILLG